MRKIYYCLPIVLLLSACANDAMKTEDIKSMRPNCANVDHQIGVLETERKNNDKRLKAGVTSILPISAVNNLVHGSYGNNVKVATGEWAAEVNTKLKELYRLKAECRTSGQL